MGRWNCTLTPNGNPGHIPARNGLRSPADRQRGEDFLGKRYYKDGVEEIINVQPRRGKAKAYQVKQVRELILKYQLEIN